MPLSSAEKTAVSAALKTLSDDITALVVDADPNPLQVALDAANAALATEQSKSATLKSQLDATNAALEAENAVDAALLAKIQKAQADLA